MLSRLSHKQACRVRHSSVRRLSVSLSPCACELESCRADQMSVSPVSKFFGGLLIAAGVLLATLSGLCSLVFVADSIGSVLRDPNAAQGLALGVVLVAISGGLPFAAGVALIFGGRAMIKPPAGRRHAASPSSRPDPPVAPPRDDL